MDYHLPHHLFASVPHYKLKDLHNYLLGDPQYAEKGLVVEGWSHHKSAGHPTIVDVLGRATHQTDAKCTWTMTHLPMRTSMTLPVLRPIKKHSRRPLGQVAAIAPRLMTADVQAN